MYYDGLRNGVHEGLMQDGRRCFLLPAIPTGHGQRPTVIPDYIAYPDLLGDRKQQTLPAGGRDSTALLRRNVEENLLLGPMKDWKELWDREKGKTCVLVCPGPSLTESLPELAVRVKDDVFTMGFNRSHRVMDTDYFVLVDRLGQPDWITREISKTILIAATSGATAVAEEFTDRYWGEEFLEGIDEGMTRLHSGLPITLCEAMYAAYRMGAKKIELYGCDFAISGNLKHDPRDGKIRYLLQKYYVDQKSHVGTDSRRGTFPESWPVTGIDGRVVFVNYELMAYAGYTTAMCMMLGYAGVEVVNKSKTGILFWGFNG